MVWNASLPANATKIRAAPDLIQANWTAIEDGEKEFLPIAINFNNRSPAAPTPPEDPAAIAEAVILYSKDDTPGDPQLYAIDPASLISTLTPLIPTVSANGFLQLPGGLQMLWGTLGGAAGTKTFHTPFTTAIFNLQVTTSDPGARYGSVRALSITDFIWVPDLTVDTIHYFAIGN